MFFRDLERLTSEHSGAAVRLARLDELLSGATDRVINPRNAALLLGEPQPWVEQQLNALANHGSLLRLVIVECECGGRTPLDESEEGCLECGHELTADSRRIVRFRLTAPDQERSRELVSGAKQDHLSELIGQDEDGVKAQVDSVSGEYPMIP